MILKEIMKDLFGSNAVVYWKNEGCNIRMRKYNSVNKILKVIQFTLMLFMIIYLISVSTISIINIQNSNIKESLKFILNVYEISFIGIIALNIIDYKIKSYSLEKLFYNIIRSFMVLPLIALIMFYFELIGHLMLSFWILVVFIVVNCLINEFNNKVKFLYEVSIGKEN